MENGFLIVASKGTEYIEGANFLAASIKDYYPEAHITLVCDPDLRPFADEMEYDLIMSENVPSHIRTKLWALYNTPYTNLTVYVDADMECMHTDVQKIWDEMPEDADILITKIRPYNGKEYRWPGGKTIPEGRMWYHGGFFMYRNNPQTMNFMKRWWDDYFEIRAKPWPYDPEECRPSFGQWDQFIFWRLMEVDKLPVNVQVFKDDARWNFVNGYYSSETKSPYVFYHHTLPKRAAAEQESLKRERAAKAKQEGKEK